MVIGETVIAAYIRSCSGSDFAGKQWWIQKPDREPDGSSDQACGIWGQMAMA